MQGFITEHWAVAATVINVLAGVCVFLGVALIRVKFGHIDGEQERQNDRLAELEDNVSDLKGDRRAASVEVKNLGKLIERHFQDVSEYKKANDRAHDEIKVLLRSSQPQVAR